MGRMKRAQVWLTTAVLAAASVGFGPSGPGAKVTKEQLDYSKQMFGEGEAAMEAGDFATALAKFQEGYRYAPHLHVFTYNIASAANALSDCRTAFTYYRMFIDLVPEHPKREEVQARYAELEQSCELDQETDEVNSPPEQGKQSMKREDRAAIRALNEAYGAIRSTQQLYDASKNKYPDQPFNKHARRKRKDAKKVLKLAGKLGVEVSANDFETLDVPGSEKDACRTAERQEKRIIEALDEAMEHYDTKPAYRTLAGARRAAERAAFAFDACSS